MPGAVQNRHGIGGIVIFRITILSTPGFEMSKESSKSLTLGGVDDVIPANDRLSIDKKPVAKRQRKDQTGLGNVLYLDLGSWQTRIGTCINNLMITESLIPGDTKKTFKSPFERDILVNFSHLEKLLDSLLVNLVSQGDSSSHLFSLIITAPFGYPLEEPLREFLTSSYSIFKEITLVPDWLSSFSTANSSNGGIVVSLGFHSIHVAKIYKGGTIAAVQRIEVGAFQAAEMMSRLMILKYPNCRLAIPQCLALIPKACYVALDFHKELELLLDDPNAWICLNNPISTSVTVGESSSTTKRGISLEKRREMAEKLQERVRQQREEKIKLKEEELSELKGILENGESGDAEYWISFGYNTFGELEKKIKSMERQILEIRRKLDPNNIELPELAEEAIDYSLLEVPDTELSPDQIKEKRRVRLIKATSDARLRMKEQKEAEQRKLDEEQELDDLMRANDFEAWKRVKFDERSRLSDLIKTIQKERTELASRKSSGKRLRAIIKDTFTGEAADDSGEDDGFGLDDSDWNIYRSREAEEEDLNSRVESLTSQLLKVESQLETHAKGELINVLEREAEMNKTILDKLIYDSPPGCFYMGIERIRIPEIFFQPSIIGMEQAGLIEVLSNIIKKEPSESAINLYLTGGLAMLEGLKERIQKDLSANLPEFTSLSITKIGDELSAWMGLQNFHK